jgi:cytosine/adenosine deaminase-related metal-dependent hydrolase
MKAPGFVNAHTHVYSGLVPFGMPAPSPRPRDFLEILGKVWWRLDRALDETSLRAAARWYVADALLHGTTTLVDHHESPGFIEGSLDVIADACEEMGLRALLCYGATERNGGRDEARRGLAESARFVRENRRPHVRGMIGLHASFTVSNETLEEAGALGADLEVGTHVHVAEDLADVEDAHRRGASGPLGRMFACGALPPGSILAHGVHLQGAQVRDADANRLWFVQNPRSNRANRVGYPGWLAASGRVALGTDGFPSDMRDELDALREIAAWSEPGTPPGVLVRRLEAGHDLAAEHFGEMELASDVVEWTGAAPMTPAIAVRLASAPGVATQPVPATAVESRPLATRVVVAGHTVVRDGRLVSGDLDEIRTRAREQAGRLWARMEVL